MIDLRQKWHGVPVGVWVLGGTVVTVGGLIFLRRYRAAKAANTASAYDGATDPNSPGGKYGAPLPGYGGGGGGIGGIIGTTPATETGTSSDPVADPTYYEPEIPPQQSPTQWIMQPTVPMSLTASPTGVDVVAPEPVYSEAPATPDMSGTWHYKWVVDPTTGVRSEVRDWYEVGAYYG